MDFNDTKEEADFRLEVKTWLKENASKGEKVGAIACAAIATLTSPHPTAHAPYKHPTALAHAANATFRPPPT